MPLESKFESEWCKSEIDRFLETFQLHIRLLPGCLHICDGVATHFSGLG